jgi:hypothetical protein
MQHMAALVIGIHVRPRGVQEPKLPVSQQIRLLVRSRANVYGEYPGFGFVLDDSPMAATPDSFSVPGPTLELTRGKRVAVTIVNQAYEPMAVHWHGIELESYPDGVPGWSGSGKSILPQIMPGDSLTVRFTPPRAGTFMYHSHSNEMQQIASGLYGAIIVREPGAQVDSAERTLLFSDDGPMISFIKPGPPVLLNGKAEPDTIEVPAGRATRLRLINIRSEIPIELALERDGAPVMWRILAKDGAALPEHQIRTQPAKLRSAPGEAYDVEVTPEEAGTMVLKFLGQPRDTTTQRAIIRVRSRVAAAQSDAMATVSRFVDAFNKGDTKVVLETCSERSFIIDEFAPYAWEGADGCSRWIADYGTDATKNKITDGRVTLGQPLHVDVSADRAYIVVPVSYEYKQNGKPVRESDSILTVALHRSAGAWRIDGWAWSKR